MKLVNLIVLALVTAAAAIAPALAQEAGPDPLTSAKLAADLGDGAEAERLLASVAEDASAPAARRGEALVRLGALRRGRGDSVGANEAFRAALARGGSDLGVLALLARSVEGVSANEDILRAALGKALLTEDGGRLQLDLGGSDATSACALDSVTPVTLSLQDSDLADAAWLITEAAGMPVVLSPCLESASRRVSVDFVALPAGQALAALQRMQGLRCARQGTVLIIGCAESAPGPASTCVLRHCRDASISRTREAEAPILHLHVPALSPRQRADHVADRNIVQLHRHLARLDTVLGEHGRPEDRREQTHHAATACAPDRDADRLCHCRDACRRGARC